MNVLIIEDDARVSSFLSRGLKAEGYTAHIASNAEEGLHLLRQAQHAFDIVLLDVMLPGMSGVEACQQLRAERIQTPVLMLTAMGGVQDRVTGLRCGADDYLTKPFAFDELLARIEALLRRPALQNEHRPDLALSDVRFDRRAMQVFRADTAITLTAKELALLELLMSAPE
jgi:DNA-binding response OmpR family regulator